MKKLLYAILLVTIINTHGSHEPLKTSNFLTSVGAAFALQIPYAVWLGKKLYNYNPQNNLLKVAVVSSSVVASFSTSVAGYLLPFIIHDNYPNKQNLTTSLFLGAACLSTVSSIKYNKRLDQLVRNNNQFFTSLVPSIIAATSYYGWVSNDWLKASGACIGGVAAALLMRKPVKEVLNNRNHLSCKAYESLDIPSIAIESKTLCDIAAAKKAMNNHLSRPFLLQLPYYFDQWLHPDKYINDGTTLSLKNDSPIDMLFDEQRSMTDIKIEFLKRQRMLENIQILPAEIIDHILSFLSCKDLNQAYFNQPILSLVAADSVRYLDKKFLSHSSLIGLLNGLKIKKDDQGIFYIGYPPHYVAVPEYLTPYIKTFLGIQHNKNLLEDAAYILNPVNQDNLCQGRIKFIYYSGYVYTLYSGDINPFFEEIFIRNNTLLPLKHIQEKIFDAEYEHPVEDDCKYCDLYRKELKER